MVGHSNLGFADALRVAERDGRLTYIGIRHEGAAAFAAGAYGKLTGELAACFAIAGPGSTNLLTGLYDAKVDGAPVLAISGQVPSKVKGRGAFQDLGPRTGLRRCRRLQPDRAGRLRSRRAHVARNASTRWSDTNVAHLVLPDEVQELPASGEAAGPEGRVGDPRVSPHPDVLAAAADRIRHAERPLFVVGRGAGRDMGLHRRVGRTARRGRRRRPSRPRVRSLTTTLSGVACSAAAEHPSPAGS